LAQITPDDTLGAEGSRVRPNATVDGRPADLIEGGATRGINLFHSFQEFNVEEQQRVYFDNPAGIDNIFSRVTGGNPSEYPRYFQAWMGLLICFCSIPTASCLVPMPAWMFKGRSWQPQATVFSSRITRCLVRPIQQRPC
ncbi:MAG: filamentous hemagglutinin N-terminal domain-containing protein, partial [Leptolyngbyaceae cyanobacterium SM1_4_3]|nr:filamentous hemagglutinin N-terminal domain-containing protein [Leptolyngbyaceae cyanobacterium SM1_4_3]